MALVYTLLASFLIAFCQFCIRAKAEDPGKDEPLMAVRFLISAIICIFAFPVMHNNYSINRTSLLLALAAGILQGLLMLYTRKALACKSSNISIALLNSTCIAPPILMAALFGRDFNFCYSLWNALGAILVIFGFIYAGKSLVKQPSFNAKLAPVSHPLQNLEQPNVELIGNSHLPIKGLFFALLFQIAFQLFLQWKSLNYKPLIPKSALLPFQNSNDSLWFNAIMFSTCALFQLSQLPKNRTKVTRQEWLTFGVLGGIATGFSGVLLLISIDLAKTTLENLLIYPLLSIGTICFCQIWAKWMFQEKLCWQANVLFILGILLSCV